MLILLMLLNTSHSLGIGVGSYPNGTLSLKFHSAPITVFQITAGFGGWGSYYDRYTSEMALGGRALFGISSGGNSNSVQYTHFLGVGAGVHSYNHSWHHDIYYESGAYVLGEGFYECEFFINPAPLSFELGIGLVVGEFGFGFAPIVGMHYYLK
ncbi:MAG: hypothetical protein WC614_10375 [bacterium]